MEYELKVTVNSVASNRSPNLFYYPPDELQEGMADIARAYGHFDQWTVVVTRIYKREKQSC